MKWDKAANDRLWWMLIEQGRDVANVAKSLNCTQKEVRRQVAYLQQNPPQEPIERPADLKDTWGSDDDDHLWLLVVTQGQSIEDCAQRFKRSARFLTNRLQALKNARSLDKPILIPDWFTPPMAELVQSLLQYSPRSAAQYVAMQKQWKEKPPSTRTTRGSYQLKTG